MKIIKDEYGYIFKDEDVSDAADATAFAVAHIKKHITNADRIRAMTDEELAKFLDNTDGDFPPNVERCSIEESEECWLEWLRQEADG